MVRETRVQSQVTSYQRLWKCNLIPPYLTLSNIRYVSRVKWINPGKGEVPSPTPWYRSYWKGSLLVALDYGHQLSFFYLLYIYIILSFSCVTHIGMGILTYWWISVGVCVSIYLSIYLSIYIYIYIYIYNSFGLFV